MDFIVDNEDVESEPHDAKSSGEDDNNEVVVVVVVGVGVGVGVGTVVGICVVTVVAIVCGSVSISLFNVRVTCCGEERGNEKIVEVLETGVSLVLFSSAFVFNFKLIERGECEVAAVETMEGVVVDVDTALDVDATVDVVAALSCVPGFRLGRGGGISFALFVFLIFSKYFCA
jgi:hypothetical protein